jgi:histidinol-phosphate aminotransferase
MTPTNPNMNRRKWLRSGMLLTGGLSVFPGAWNQLVAFSPSPVSTDLNTCLSDQAIALNAPPELKARLFANENPFGPGDKAKKAVAEALTDSYMYPFQVIRQLESKIVSTENVRDSQLMMAAGSSPILLAAAMHFARNGGTVISGDPSYDDLPEKVKRFGGNWVKVPLTGDYKLDLDAIEKKIDGNTSLIYICNPNNPTATVLDPDRLRAFCEKISPRVPIFIDEAYIDYLDDPKAYSMTDCVRKGMNVIIARTFSKLHGFAGLRVGYGIGQPDLMNKLEQYTSGNMCISVTSASAALASYDDAEYLEGALQKTKASKEFLYKTLKDEGYEYIPSAANFVMFPLKMNGGRFVQEMMKRGVGIRDWKLNGKDWCRVSIGRMDQMQAFAEAFKQLS